MTAFLIHLATALIMAASIFLVARWAGLEAGLAAAVFLITLRMNMPFDER